MGEAHQRLILTEDIQTGGLLGRATGMSHARSPRLDLLRISWIQKVLVNRWPQFILRCLTLAGFLLIILAGLCGARVGSDNFAIIFVWVAWWTALKLVFIPLGGRSWCSICPIPLPGEWIQQASLTGRIGKRFGLNLRWPHRLRGSWLQSAGFLLIGLFSAVTLTDPRVTAWVLLGLILLAVILSLIFENRAFCSSLCPIGGFTGLYAQTAPVELRVAEPSICASHQEKTCYQACPWGVYPLALKDNNACGLCMECVRACPKDNLSLNLRPFGTDLLTIRPEKRMDDTFLALVMLASALAFSAVFTGPWGVLKTAAFEIGSSKWVLYGLGFLALNLLVMPGFYSLSVWLGEIWAGKPDSKRPRTSFRQALAIQSRLLLPLGLCAWIAFTISFALPKIGYVLQVISDPFGWGWNLFGTAHNVWSPDISWFSPILQAAIMLVGLFWSASLSSQQVNSSSLKKLQNRLPLLVFCMIYCAGMLWLLIG
jgi:NAD-dependent dihydropyrimidine dehydrogenase PreA subunit